MSLSGFGLREVLHSALVGITGCLIYAASWPDDEDIIFMRKNALLRSASCALFNVLLRACFGKSYTEQHACLMAVQSCATMLCGVSWSLIKCNDNDDSVTGNWMLLVGKHLLCSALGIMGCALFIDKFKSTPCATRCCCHDDVAYVDFWALHQYQIV